MDGRIDLIVIGECLATPHWPLGDVCSTQPTVRALADLVEKRLHVSEAEAWLFWAADLGTPKPETVATVLRLPGDAWHAGLRLGMGGQPGAFDFVHPTWPLNCDSPAAVESSSWRMSLRAALIRTDVLRRMGNIRPDFQTLAGAALEMGLRYVTRGVLLRHVPWLAPADAATAVEAIPLTDEIRLLYYRTGRFWTRWATMRALLTGYASPLALMAAYREATRGSRPGEPMPFYAGDVPVEAESADPRVTVLIPTIERYPYLHKLLTQMREQTVRPFEIIVVDQTPRDQRDESIAQRFPDLPLRVIYLDQSGQSTSRNSGLQVARGDYILFIDDDDEVRPNLIASHLANLARFRAEVSCGVAEEAGAGALPETFSLIRTSDVFPTNNSLVRRSVLERSGLFDVAYDRGQRADGDLGMRLYLSGALMVLNPGISVFHHHAPRGGLRVHKARVVTYASSRHRLFHRQLPSVTELYLNRRYFNPRQQREWVWLQVLGTLSGRGGLLRRLLKLLIGLLYLPSTCLEVHARRRQATELLERFPQIPQLGPAALEIGEERAVTS